MRHVVLVGSLLAGLAAGWFIVPAADAPVPPVEVPAEPAENGTVAETDPAVAGPADTVDLPPPPVAGGDPPSDLSALLARFPAREYPSGDGAITGRVLLDDGTPLAGIAIHAIIHGITPGVEPVGIDHAELLPFVLEEIDQYHYDAAMARRSVSDEEGYYRCEGLLADATYHLSTDDHEEWYFYPLAAWSQISPGAVVDFRAARFATIEVEVVDSRGSPIPFGTVEMRNPREQRGRWFRVPFSPVEREIRVPLPFTRLVARAPGGAASEPVDLALSAGERVAARFIIREPSRFDVAVHAPEKLDLLGVGVRIDVDGGSREPEEDGEFCNLGSLMETHVDPETGRAMIPSAPGRYRVTLVRDGVELAAQLVTLGEGRLGLDFSIPPRDRSRVALIRVLDPEGAPVDRAHFLLEHRIRLSDGSEQNSHAGSNSVHLADGVHAILESWGYQSQDGETTASVTYRLRCKSDRFGDLVVPISLGSSSIQDVRFAEPARLVADLIGYVGSDLQGRIEAWLLDSEEGHRSMSAGRIDPIGRVIFEPFAAGEALVRITIDGTNMPVVEERVRLHEGENLLSWPLPELHRLVVRYPEKGRPRETYLHTASGDWVAGAQIGEDGLAEFGDLTAGTFRLGGEDESMEVHVPAGGTVEYRPAVANSLEVTIDDGEGWLARAGFRDGDRIVGFGGERTSGARALQYSVMRAIASGAGGEILIEREGAEVRLAIPAADPSDVYPLGGSFFPEKPGGGR